MIIANRSLWKKYDTQFITSRNGCGNQAIDPRRTFGEMIVYSPGLRRLLPQAMAA
jgi:hypothetical protein